MDQLDLKIIDILRDDGRTSNATIARKFGVSEGTVRRRLKKLIRDEYINVVALPDPSKMGKVAQALVGIQVDPDKVDDVVAELANLEAVEWVKMTTGSFDVFAWAALSSSEELRIFLHNKVGTVPGVRRTETFVNLDGRNRGLVSSVVH